MIIIVADVSVLYIASIVGYAIEVRQEIIIPWLEIWCKAFLKKFAMSLVLQEFHDFTRSHTNWEQNLQPAENSK